MIDFLGVSALIRRILTLLVAHDQHLYPSGVLYSGVADGRFRKQAKVQRCRIIKQVVAHDLAFKVAIVQQFLRIAL